jgi:hypothetical protein
MNSFLKAETDLMVSNFRILKGTLKWQSSFARNVMAIHYALNGQEVNLSRMMEIKEYIKSRTSSWKYYFRGYNLYFLATLLSFEDGYQRIFQNMLDVFDKMKTLTAFKSPSLLLAGFVIVKHVEPDAYDDVISKMKVFYHQLRSHHKFLTNQYDYVLIAYCIISNCDMDKAISNMEFCYGYLHEHGFSISKDLFVVSQLLSLCSSRSLKDSCDRNIRIGQFLKDFRCRPTFQARLILGCTSMLDAKPEDIAGMIADVFYHMLEYKDCYGFWHFDKSTKLMFATAIVVGHFLRENENAKEQFMMILYNTMIAKMQAQEAAAAGAAGASSAA